MTVAPLPSWLRLLEPTVGLKRFVFVAASLVVVLILTRIFLVSLLDLLFAILILLALESEGHHFWVDGIAWLPQLVVLVGKVALIA